MTYCKYVYTQVNRLLYSEDKTKVIGVEYQYRNKIFQCFAKKEVIVSAGAINTPKLLQLSGIGPRDTLRAHNIEVVQVLYYLMHTLEISILAVTIAYTHTHTYIHSHIYIHKHTHTPQYCHCCMLFQSRP